MEHPLRDLVAAGEREAAYRERRDFYWRYRFGTSLIYLSVLPGVAILCFLAGRPTLAMACLAAFAGAFAVGSLACAVLAHRRARRELAGGGKTVERPGRG
jgi:hypothetical protein